MAQGTPQNLNLAKVTAQRKGRHKKQSKRERERGKRHPVTAGLQVPFCYDIVDCGAELNTSSEDFQSIVSTAIRCGVRKLILLGTDVASSLDALESTEEFPDSLFCTAGFHPRHAREWSVEAGEVLREVAAQPRCRALGPCGLDLSEEEGIVSVEEQLLALQTQIACAKELRKPLVVCEMASHAETLGQLTAHLGSLDRVAIKCDPLCSVSDLEEYLAAGCHLFLYGFPHPTAMELWLKQASSDRKRKAAVLPRLLLTSNLQSRQGSDASAFRLNTMTEKTSAVFKTCRTVQNQPASLPAVVEAAAMFLKMSPEELAAQLKRNAETFFFSPQPAESPEEFTETGSEDDVPDQLPKGSGLRWVVAAAVVLILIHFCVLLFPG